MLSAGVQAGRPAAGRRTISARIGAIRNLICEFQLKPFVICHFSHGVRRMKNTLADVFWGFYVRSLHAARAVSLKTTGQLGGADPTGLEPKNADGEPNCG
jgi:hypothetical protein